MLNVTADGRNGRTRGPGFPETKNLQRMQIRQQIIDLLRRELLAVGWHFVAAVQNQVPRALIVGRHPADTEIIPAKDSLQAWPLPLAGRIRLVAAVAILIVDVPAQCLLRIESKLGIAFAPLSGATSECQEDNKKGRKLVSPSGHSMTTTITERKRRPLSPKIG